jgi:5-bromo-4-chloroindolyl phosphate hydrolysis protein
MTIKRLIPIIGSIVLLPTFSLFSMYSPPAQLYTAPNPAKVLSNKNKPSSTSSSQRSSQKSAQNSNRDEEAENIFYQELSAGASKFSTSPATKKASLMVFSPLFNNKKLLEEQPLNLAFMFEYYIWRADFIINQFIENQTKYVEDTSSPGPLLWQKIEEARQESALYLTYADSVLPNILKHLEVKYNRLVTLLNFFMTQVYKKESWTYIGGAWSAWWNKAQWAVKKNKQSAPLSDKLYEQYKTEIKKSAHNHEWFTPSSDFQNKLWKKYEDKSLRLVKGEYKDTNAYIDAIREKIIKFYENALPSMLTVGQTVAGIKKPGDIKLQEPAIVIGYCMEQLNKIYNALNKEVKAVNKYTIESAHNFAKTINNQLSQTQTLINQLTTIGANNIASILRKSIQQLEEAIKAKYNSESYLSSAYRTATRWIQWLRGSQATQAKGKQK